MRLFCINLRLQSYRIKAIFVCKLVYLCNMIFKIIAKNACISIVGLPTEPVLSIGCYENDECPLFNACENTKCINPCAERNPCAPSAICKVINHEPECTCPDGFIGSPLTDCRPRK